MTTSQCKGRVAPAVCFLFALLVEQSAGAGGLYLSEFGTADMGTAGAGSIARTEDAATAIMNPAGMTYIDDHQAQFGAAPGYGLIKFDKDGGPLDPRQNQGNNGGNQSGFVPLVGSSYVHKLSDRFRFGFALVSMSGASLDARGDWAGRNEVQQIDLLTFTFLPTLAYRVTDWLSLGAGPAITYAMLDWKLESPGPLRSRIKLDDFDDVEPAAFVGALLQPVPEVRIGLVYQSKTDLYLDGDLEAGSAVELTSTKIGLPLATALRGEVWWDVTPKVALMAGAAWEDWSEANQVPVRIEADAGEEFNLKAKLGMHDTWKLRGGIHYKLNDAWTLTSGASYDSSPLDTKNRTPSLPLDEQTRVSIGAIHQLNDTLQLSTAFQWTHLGSADLNDTFIKGHYDANEILFLMFNVNFKKLPWSGKATF